MIKRLLYDDNSLKYPCYTIFKHCPKSRNSSPYVTDVDDQQFKFDHKVKWKVQQCNIHLDVAHF